LRALKGIYNSEKRSFLRGFESRGIRGTWSKDVPHREKTLKRKDGSLLRGHGKIAIPEGCNDVRGKGVVET